MQYQVLSQTHPDYRRDTWSELELLYRGGYDLDDVAKQRLLPQAVGEHPARYTERVSASQYVNYFAQVVDFFAAALFSKQLTVRPAEGEESRVDMDVYDAFSEDATRKAESLNKILREVFTNALVYRRGLLALDFPAAGEVQDRATESALGLGRPYAWCLHPTQLLDWSKADDGSFDWAIVHSAWCERESPEGMRDVMVEQFKVWQTTPQGAYWQLYESRRKKTEKKPKGPDEIPLVAEGRTSFKRVPIVDLVLPFGLWVGNKIGPLAKEHFQRRSKLSAAVSKSLFAIPYVKLGSEIPEMGGALPAERAQSPGRADDLRDQLERRGYTILGSQDEIGFEEPKGSAFSLEAESLDGLVNEMFRVGHQMAMSVANTSKALARSGLSKTEDRHATEIVLKAYGQLMREFAVRTYDTVAEARNEDVSWQPYGLDKFEVWDRTQIVEEGTRVRDIDIPAPTFQREYFGQVAERLLEQPTPEVMSEIRKEIEESLEREASAAHDALAALDMTSEDDGDDEDEDEDRGGDDEGGAPSPPSPPRRGVRRTAATR